MSLLLDITDLYRDLRHADLDISGANVKAKRSTLLAGKSFLIKRPPPPGGGEGREAGVGCRGEMGGGVKVQGEEGEEDPERERTCRLLCLTRTLKVNKYKIINN